ncbi:MAG: hypothetical protein MHM6MM_005947, partial [Cercozoa sp. M6MM]
MEREFVSKVFWPQGCGRDQRGYILGWNLHGFVICVAGVVVDVELGDLDRAIASLSADRSLRRVFAQCGGAPQILGEWLGDDTDAGSCERRREAPIWLTVR